MLANVYSYRVMVKSVSSYCVRGRWVLSNPVTFGDPYKVHQTLKLKSLHVYGKDATIVVTYDMS